MAYHSTMRGRRAKGEANVRPLLAALGDPTRQEIIEQLRGGARTVGELSALLPVSRPAVSQHLKVLREAGAVIETRQGARHYFALDANALDGLRGYFERMWQEALLSFATYVKEAERARKSK